MVESYKYKSKITNAIVFLAGLIVYLGKDELAKILPANYAYLAGFLVLVAGYIAVQTTENTRVLRAEQIVEEQYENTKTTEKQIIEDIDPSGEYEKIQKDDDTNGGA